MKPAYRRVLLKLSGERLAGDGGFGLSPAVIRGVAEEVRRVHELGVALGIVIGGGNIIRGLAAEAQGMDRTSADQMGMLASVINALALQDALEKQGLVTRVLSAITIQEVCEPYIRRRALRHLEKGRVLLFAGGTGNPYFTTDSAAVLRAAEMEAEVVLKGTRVDGVYDRDPHGDPGALRFERLSHDEALRRNLRVMDQAAIALARDNRLPIVVFDMTTPGNVVKAVCGERIGTVVGD